MGRELGQATTALSVFLIGLTVSLIGDAGHVLSGTTHYGWPQVPRLFHSALWFPLLVGSSLLGVAHFGARLSLPTRPRSRAQLLLAVLAVLALYGLTATLRTQPCAFSLVVCSGAALAIWAWWDPSRGALLIATGAALVGPLAEIGFVKLGAVTYAPDSSALFGVAAWLPCLYFAAASVASGTWRVISGRAHAASA